GSTAPASGPNDRTHDTRLSDAPPATSASTHPSSRVRTTRAPGAVRRAHQGTSDEKATRASPAGSPIPHGPAFSCSLASNPSGGADPSPASSTSDRNRDRRNDLGSRRSRSS